MRLNSLPSKIKKFERKERQLENVYSSFKKHTSVIKGERKAINKATQKTERIFIKISHFHSVRIWDKKRKPIMKKFDEGKFLHDIKT